jgi:exopolysaccharide biosynthesis polyprenyl glycosylphosphotransferase
MPEHGNPVTQSVLHRPEPAADPPPPVPALAPVPLVVAPGARAGGGRLWALAAGSAIALATAAAAAGAHLAGLTLGPPAAVVAFDLLAFGGQVRLSRRIRLQGSLLDDVAHIVAGTASAGIVVLAARALLWPRMGMATESFRLWVYVAAYLVAARAAVVVAARWSRAGTRYAPQATLILGAGMVGRRVARRLLDGPASGLRPVGFLDDDPLDGPGEPPLPVLGTFADLERAVASHGVTHVLVCFSRARHDVLLDLLRRCRRLGLAVALVPRLYEDVTRRVRVDHLGGIAVLQVDHVDPRGWQFAVKYLLDRVVAAVALAVLSPLLAVLAVAVRLSSPGPILYRCRRVGLDGRQFDMLKFRTMRGSPETDGAFNDDWAARELGLDWCAGPPVDRRTPLGRWLRRLSLDELPQLLNVVRGEMSFIGPRPERVALAAGFEQRVYRYGDRHRVKSGITGWAQVHGLRGDTSLADRIEWDNYYIENWSPWLDLKIAVLTIPAMLAGRNAG